MGTILDIHSQTGFAVGEAIPSLNAPGLIDESPYEFSVDQYEAMIESGILTRDCYVELWEGRIYQKMAKNIPHNVAGNKAVMRLVRLLPDGWYVGPESTIVLGGRSAPLPDLVILRGEPDDYRHRRPGPGDVGLIIEIAESSLKSDLGPKLIGYARAGVVNYWVVNLVANTVHVHQGPNATEGRYGITQVYSRGQTIPLVLDGVHIGEVAVDDLLPRLDG